MKLYDLLYDYLNIIDMMTQVGLEYMDLINKDQKNII